MSGSEMLFDGIARTAAKRQPDALQFWRDMDNNGVLVAGAPHLEAGCITTYAAFLRWLRRIGQVATRLTPKLEARILAATRKAPSDPEFEAKAAQKDTQARWTLKTGRRKTPIGAQQHMPEIAIPVFGYKSHIAIDRAYGFIGSTAVTDAACHDGRMLRRLVTSDNLAAGVWADTAYRSKDNEAWLAGKGRISHIHRKKPPGRAMPGATARANTHKSAVRARIEHVFAHQKGGMGLFIRTIGLKRAEAKIGLANLAYNFQRLIFHERRAAMA